MNTLYILYGVVGLVLLVSIALALLNWFYIASTTTQISKVEGEVRKKSTEFDSLRKEIQQARKELHTNEDINAAPAFAQASDIESAPDKDSGQIQIVRNVRTSYNPQEPITEQQTINPSPSSQISPEAIPEPASPDSYNYSEEQSQPPAPSPIMPEPEQPLPPPPPIQSTSVEQSVAPISTHSQEPAQKTIPPINKNYAEMAQTPPPGTQPVQDNGSSIDSDILDIVDEGQQNEPAQRTTMIIPLYSTSKKDADFARAWRVLSEKLPYIDAPHIRLDFDNILFLYEKEIHYLEQIKTTVQMHKGILSFINCQQELEYILRSNVALSPCIEK